MEMTSKKGWQEFVSQGRQMWRYLREEASARMELHFILLPHNINRIVFP